MTRENIKQIMPIISAFAEGKVIQILNERDKWVDLTEREGLPMGTLEETPDIFRIKPELKYRPFANAEECCAEMLKHQPFGWVKWDNVLRNIYSVSPSSVCIIDRGYSYTDLAYAYKELTFADGTPFGIKVEE